MAGWVIREGAGPLPSATQIAHPQSFGAPRPFLGQAHWCACCQGDLWPALARERLEHYPERFRRAFPGRRPVPACLSGRVPFESMTSGNIPLAGVLLPLSLTVPQPGRMMSWENRRTGRVLNLRILSSARSGTGLAYTAAPLAPPGPAHVLSLFPLRRGKLPI